MSDVCETVEGLRRFLLRSAGLCQQGAPEPEGLQAFLRRAGPLLRAPPASTGVPAPPVRPEFDPARLMAAMAALSGPLQQVPPVLPALNVWSVAGLRRDELRNAAVLAWFLHPLQSHGLGPAFLAAFLGEAARARSDWAFALGDLSRTSVATEEWPLDSSSDRVDIALDGTDFCVFVEVKIDAREGPDQLVRYATQARRKAKATGRAHGRVVYLSLRPPRHVPPDVSVITWREVASALSCMPRQTDGGKLAAQFAQHIRTFL